MNKISQILQVKNMRKSFLSSGELLTIFDDVSFGIQKGTITALRGESGSGKTTLLHILAGLEQPSSGQVEIEKNDLWKLTENDRAMFRLKNLAVIFQNYNLVPSLNIEDNLSLHAKLIGNLDRSLLSILIETLDLAKLLLKYPEEISGGQQQRVAIARSLIAKPKLIFADEPTGNLDHRNSEKVLAAFNMIVKQYEATVIIATHSDQLSKLLNSRLLIGSGKITKERTK